MARRDFFPGDYGFQEVREYRLPRRELFAPRERPRYFGTGNYGSGEGAFTGGYAELTGPADSGFEAHPERPVIPEIVARNVEYRRRPAGRAPKNYRRTDERIREDICERLIREERIDASDVSVAVQERVVRLEGSVPDQFMKHAIESVADGCPDVEDIENRIRVRGR